MPVTHHVNHPPTPSVGRPPADARSPRRQRPLGSRVLHQLGQASQSTAASTAAALISVVFLLGALLSPRATPWLTAFEALAAAVTLVMVFALQHTQARQQAALQRKLDEILRVLPGADPRLLHLETAAEDELHAVGQRHDQIRADALNEHRT